MADYIARLEACTTRAEAVDLYAEALAHELTKVFDWSALNRAIVEKWSESGLDYIKERAWKETKGKVLASTRTARRKDIPGQTTFTGGTVRGTRRASQHE